VPVAFPSEDDPFLGGSPLEQDENNYTSSNVVIYRSPSHNTSRVRLPTSSESAGYSYPMRQTQSLEALARQKAAADKEARLKVIASILLNRVNVVGKPMRRRARIPGLDIPRTYVRSGLGRCISVAE
jgi:hypothetical protein